jgi:hypothetical protein
VLDNAQLVRSASVCHELIESAALETARLTKDVPSTPVFVFEGKTSAGLQGVKELEPLLEGLSPESAQTTNAAK